MTWRIALHVVAVTLWLLTYFAWPALPVLLAPLLLLYAAWHDAHGNYLR